MTISSIELVQMINSVREEGREELRHDNFLIKVEKVLWKGALKFKDTYKDVQGKVRPCYNFPKREASLMVMSESYKVQAKVYDRMDELEQRQPVKELTFEETMLNALTMTMSKACIYPTKKSHEIRDFLLSTRKVIYLES